MYSTAVALVNILQKTAFHLERYGERYLEIGDSFPCERDIVNKIIIYCYYYLDIITSNCSLGLI
jgi:hypothetical protein